ncbi:hypothetical protein ACFU5Z_32660 [Streptomyces sp. NPDC057521]|uniref:hypothetical protein n=1 Tax=Streptomyces sp. NPDC057521 TaxID=3346156 RepID=UPI0036AED1F9
MYAERQAGQRFSMRSQTITRYFKKEPTTRQLKVQCWGFAIFSVLELAVFVMTLTDPDPSMWTLVCTGFGTIFFPVMLVVAWHQLRKKKTHVKQ